jgi:hypothetical protein
MTRDRFDQAFVNAFSGLRSIMRCQEDHAVTAPAMSEHLMAVIPIKESSRRQTHLARGERLDLPHCLNGTYRWSRALPPLVVADLHRFA